jgi:NTP pyrophosphatase (non-canonical NTP hydrolase)
VSDIDELTIRIRKFAKARDWERFHNPKNLVMALSVEASELVEIFQWLTAEEALTLTETAEGLAAVRDEIADVVIYLLRLADELNVSVVQAVNDKLDRNETRFPPGPSSQHGT